VTTPTQVLQGCRATLRIEAVGALAAVQDLGRPGYAALGVGESGAADRTALRLANRLVGNAEGAAVVEVLLGGLRVRAGSACVVAVTGAPVALSRNDRAVPLCAPIALTPGDVLDLGMPLAGLHSYLAIRGGLHVEQSLGSASTDLSTGIGPAALAVGDPLRAGSRVVGPPAFTDLAAPSTPAPEIVLRAVLGPREDWFEPRSVAILAAAPWSVAPDSDRVGVRLSGPILPRLSHHFGELPSEPVVRGCVQVPASGQPIVFGPDHPTTGGYPVIAVVVDKDTDLLAQARPGQRVRFHLVRAAWTLEVGPDR
jgi:biotin-dependent carboxylase-like uncharacterized protein